MIVSVRGTNYGKGNGNKVLERDGMTTLVLGEVFQRTKFLFCGEVVRVSLGVRPLKGSGAVWLV